MGYIFDFNDAVAYEKWYENPHNRFVAELENRLMLDLLKPVPGESVLEIGCGTGAGLLTFIDAGVMATGIDPSPYMLDIALKNVGNRADLHRGFAEDLPFEDNSFNHACFITTLEFVEDPGKAIEEAGRVAKDRIFLGVLNSYSLKGIQRRVRGIFSSTIYNRAHFFSIWELKQKIRSILGDVPISWRTACHFPAATGWITRRLEKSVMLQRCPSGAFIGMVVTLVPRFRTRPLAVPIKAKHTPGAAAG
jgi:SAM-dependent methyltransferase